MLGVYVFTFADCMEACASWNAFRAMNTPQCFAIAFGFGPGAYSQSSGKGNCFLKDSRSIAARADPGGDAAVLQVG